MIKSISFISTAGVVLCLSSLAPAQKAPAPPSAASVLGLLDGTVNFCADLYPESAEKYKAAELSFTNGLNEEAVAQIRASNEYKDSLDQVSTHLKSLSSRDAIAACTNGTTGHRNADTKKKVTSKRD